jgi:hypothetical protein
MRKERVEAVQSVADNLYALENALDVAVTLGASLVGSIPKARLQAKISAVVGQDAFNSTAKVLACLAEARQTIVIAHQQLDQVKTDIGLETYATGGGYPKKPNDNGILHIVDSQAA